MTTVSDLAASLTMIATRSTAIGVNCSNEESAKLYLVLPVIGALGYDYTNPIEVQPEFRADFRDDRSDRVDFAIFKEGLPVVALECKKVGTDLQEARGQLRAYFAAIATVKLGILTDGLRFEFFVDSEAPNIMDEEPFMSLDMETVAKGGLPSDVLNTLVWLTKPRFDADAIAGVAEARLLQRRMRTALIEEVRQPSEDFCRLILQKAGLRNLRKSSITGRYSSEIKLAFEEAIVIPVVDRLRNRSQQPSQGEDAAAGITPARLITTDRELAVYRYVCRRLAFLATNEEQFAAIERVHHRDFIGKFAIYYENIRKGRLLDFIEGGNGYDKFIFAAPIGEIVTSTISDIDEPLIQIFDLRVREFGPRLGRTRLVQAG